MKKFIVVLCSISLVASMILLSGCSKGSKTDYYKNTDFISENKIVYETSDKSIGWGKFQKNVEELSENSIELKAGAIFSSKTKEDFDMRVKRFKQKLDILESEYAFGYSGDEGDIIQVKINDYRLGLPIFALLNINHAIDNEIVSPMGDFSVTNVKNLVYKLNDNSKFDITVEIPSVDQEKFKAYLAEHPGSTLYLKLGDLTFSSVQITEGMPFDKVTFNGFAFLGSSVNENDYEFIMRLTEYVVNNPDEGLFSMDFPNEIDDEIEYKVPYITQMDEVIINNINSLYDDVTFIREGVQNDIAIRFNLDPEKETVESCLNRVYKIYDLCNFDDGAYATISFRWPSGNIGTNNYVFFSKRNGKMVCAGYADRIKTEVRNNPFISQYLE